MDKFKEYKKLQREILIKLNGNSNYRKTINIGQIFIECPWCGQETDYRYKHHFRKHYITH